MASRQSEASMIETFHLAAAAGLFFHAKTDVLVGTAVQLSAAERH